MNGDGSAGDRGELVFVYGTLKRGEPNHGWLRGARFLGRRRLPGVRMHDLGPYPMAVPAAGEEQKGKPGRLPLIHGELFRVDAAGLAGLDRLEDVPNDYRRLRLVLSDGMPAWVYLGRAEQVIGAAPVPLGDWGTKPVFSYGSNLCPDQLAARCKGWDGSGQVARLEGWRWGISKVRSPGRGSGQPGEGAAGIQSDPGAHCWGVVHHLGPADQHALDRHEGVAAGHYRTQTLTVTTLQGECFPVSTYVPTPEWSADGLRPSPDYADRIRRGSAHWPLPELWRRTLEAALDGELGSELGGTGSPAWPCSHPTPARPPLARLDSPPSGPSHSRAAMNIQVGCRLTATFFQPTPLVLLLQPHRSRQADLIAPDPIDVQPAVPLEQGTDGFGNRFCRLVAPPGESRFSLRTVVSDSGSPDPVVPTARRLPVQELPPEVLADLNASRYCETDRLGEIAWNLFGNCPPGWPLVQAICDHVHNHIRFSGDHASSTKSAFDAFMEGRGVCRDFAHLAITFCRCLNIPARYCTGYLGHTGISFDPEPIDFSAWFEAYLDGRWYTFDARFNTPRIGRVLIARGRDAADVPFLRSFGEHQLTGFEVITEALEPG
ncbi:MULTISPECIES: gamma-glutamylcyclotransferase [unclassified Synechococcus]|uniref:gamma-glutamylcyclotransferase n=1 Tax=unclassified Synechococcus TaxID=2626047 RepID=UPI0021A832F1|nr:MULTISPECIES: gamma-glutamylcyclotransferase [unclassified Synechococcus]MCT0213528.1 gamma-glutamylcyclotransferase [Synechococcus sp. CS-1326]MCT0234684.1 gamma-glutamylcyclotransferase [Synechococcus sp. CS-1327]